MRLSPLGRRRYRPAVDLCVVGRPRGAVRIFRRLQQAAYRSGQRVGRQRNIPLAERLADRIRDRAELPERYLLAQADVEKRPLPYSRSVRRSDRHEARPLRSRCSRRRPATEHPPEYADSRTVRKTSERTPFLRRNPCPPPARFRRARHRLPPARWRDISLRCRIRSSCPAAAV